MAADLLSRDMRMAGYGMPIPASNYSAWITWASGATGPVCVLQGANSNLTDVISLVGAFEDPVGTLMSRRRRAARR